MVLLSLRLSFDMGGPLTCLKCRAQFVRGGRGPYQGSTESVCDVFSGLCLSGLCLGMPSLSVELFRALLSTVPGSRDGNTSPPYQAQVAPQMEGYMWGYVGITEGKAPQ